MLDKYGRTIDTIRISLTGQCNLRCFYCKTDQNQNGANKNKQLSLDRISEIIENCCQLDITRIKLTGGEPLLRADIIEIVEKIAHLQPVTDLSITTNGTLLPGLAGKLVAAGLKRINISLDSLDPGTYHKITGGDLKQAIKGIMAAKKACLHPIKINTVYINQNQNQAFNNHHEITRIREFCLENGFQHQLINRMKLNQQKEDQNRPDQDIHIFNKTDKPPACEKCSRIRLTSDGGLLPCLFSNQKIIPDKKDKMINYLIRCIQLKPEKGGINNNDNMYQIGG